MRTPFPVEAHPFVVLEFQAMKYLMNLFWETYRAWSADKAPQMGAALAYYCVFSLSPLLIVATAIAGLIFGEQAARGEIVNELRNTVGQPVAQAVEEMLSQANQSGAGGTATILGLILLFLGASGVVNQLQDALNTIWKVTPPERYLLGLVRGRLLSFVIVVATGILLLVSLVVSAALAALIKFVPTDALPGGTHLWQAVNVPVSITIMTLLFALIYKVLPSAPISWRDVWIGAAVTAVLFNVGNFFIGLYLGQAGTSSAYGAAGSVLVILVWVYYAAQILLFGAEFTHVVAVRSTARRNAAADPFVLPTTSTNVARHNL